jgi:DNA-binding MarR family transcriptional regulator
VRAPSISPGKLRYAPIPVRALADLRLNAMHLRTLGVVAAFDRLGKNGSGCWASQNKIAKILGIDKTNLSHRLSDLRDYGYITSEMNPDKRWFRVHRIIYTDADFDTLGADKSVVTHNNCLGKSVVTGDNFSCYPEQHQLHQQTKKDNETNDLQNMTIVPTITKTIEEAGNGLLRGQNCAEARHRSMPASEAETYLTECESLTVESLVFERKLIEQLADDPCLPEELNERAAILLCQISQ